MTIVQKAWPNLNKGLAVMLCACLAFIPKSFAAEKSDKIQTMVYEVYAGGIHAVQATMVIDQSKPGRYSIDFTAKTRGFLGRLAPWYGTFESHGWLKDNGRSYLPELHRSTATWKEEEEIKSYQYGKDKSFKGLTIKEHDKEERTEQVDDALTQGTTDALSATLQVLASVAAGDQCEGTAEVFDGKRRFKQIFAPDGEENLIANDYNIYEGATQKCTVEVQPVAGKWHKKPRGWLSIQEQGREKGTMPTVWVGTIREGAPAVPVKILVKTQFGALFMHLAEYRSGDTALVAENRETDE